MRLLVCGGRDFKDCDWLYEELDDLHEEERIDCIISGMAAGADTFAFMWAGAKQIMVQSFWADWSKHGRAAGPMRNQQMIDEGKPNKVMAFPGGTGTADMIKRAQRAAIPVIDLRNQKR